MSRITIASIFIAILTVLLLGLFTAALKDKRKADREACILNIRNIQGAVRSHHGITDQQVGNVIDWSEIFTSVGGPEKFLMKPQCPHDGSEYILIETYPGEGETPVATCPHCDTLNHRPDDTTGW